MPLPWAWAGNSTWPPWLRTLAGNALGGGSLDCADLDALPNGDYIVPSSFWDSATMAGRGAVTWARAGGVTTGLINAANSVIGPPGQPPFAFNAAHGYLLVGWPTQNIVIKAVYSYGQMLLTIIARLEE